MRIVKVYRKSDEEITYSNEGLLRKVQELTNELVVNDDMLKKMNVEEMKKAYY